MVWEDLGLNRQRCRCQVSVSHAAGSAERRGHLMTGAPNLEPRASSLKRMPRAAEGQVQTGSVNPPFQTSIRRNAQQPAANFMAAASHEPSVFAAGVVFTPGAA